MTQKRKFVNYTSPKGTASYPRLTSPDNKGPYPDNKFKVDLELTKEQFLAEKPKLDAIVADLLQGKTQSNPIIFEKTKEGDTRYFIRTKSMKMPAFVAADGKTKINPAKDKDFVVRGGSIIRFSAGAYEHKKGVSLGLNAVQVIELADPRTDFEAEEGYEYEGPSNASSFTEETAEAKLGDDDAEI